MGAFLKLPLTKSCPRVRGKCRGVAVTKGEWLKAAKCREVFPLSRLTPTAPPQAVAPFGVLYKPLAKTRGRTASTISSQSLTLTRRKADFTLRKQYFTARQRNFTRS